MGLTGGVHPLQQSQSEGVRQGWCGMTARPSAGQWDNGGAPSSPREHSAQQSSFISTTPPAHIHHDLRKPSNTLGRVSGPLEREAVCMCVCGYGTVSPFLKQCNCEFFVNVGTFGDLRLVTWDLRRPQIREQF